MIGNLERISRHNFLCEAFSLFSKVSGMQTLFDMIVCNVFFVVSDICAAYRLDLLIKCYKRYLTCIQELSIFMIGMLLPQNILLLTVKV